MCEHREHRTGNCRKCGPQSVALSNGRTVSVDDYFAGDYGTPQPVPMPQLWAGDNA